MKSILPKTKTVTYKRKSQCCGNVGKKSIEWKDPAFVQIENEENSEGLIKGYRVPCRGDSGSGQVVSMSIDSKHVQSFKYVLVAVYSSTIEDNVVENGNHVHMPCGSTALIHDSTTGKDVPHQSLARALRTSWPEILDWIKNKANI